jgi:hypothetical protein
MTALALPSTSVLTPSPSSRGRVCRHNEPIRGSIRPVVRAGETIASDNQAVKLEGFFVLQANFLQYPSRGMIVYQGCRHDALQLEVLKAVA